MKWLSALDLQQWADTLPARAAFPGLVGDLIRATVPSLESFRFPTGDKSQVRGFDGYLISTGMPPYVPDGESIWEFGLDGDYCSKAGEDFEKRTREIPETRREKTTFIFATPRTWDNPKLKLQDWVAEKRALGRWRDVGFLDGAQFESWLDDHPAVARWYARYELGRMPQVGARSTQEFWDAYSGRFTPKLSEQVLTCEREDQAKDFLARLGRGDPRIVVRADSPDEVIAFVIAAMRSAEPETPRYLEMRTLIVDTEEAAVREGACIS